MTIKQVIISCILFSLSVSGNVILAQNKKELAFNVVKKKVKIGLKPGYRYLYQNIAHPIKIIIKDTLNKYTFKLAGGTITKTDSGMFITPEAPNEAILNIFEINKGKEILVGSKKYFVLPEPKPYLRNKPTNNTMLDVLLVSGTLKGVVIYNNKIITIPVKSFTVVYKGKGNSFKSIDVVGNKIPISNRNEIVTLANGAMIYFKNIKIELIPGYETLIQPYRVSMNVIKSKDVTNFSTGN